MKRLNFLALFLVIVCSGFVNSSVGEYNYFKYGESDVSGNLAEGTGSISGASVSGFVCSDAVCSGSAGDLWGNLYSPVSGVNLVYPTSLLSSYGYGYYVYKAGYIPYYVKGTTYWGTWTAPNRNVYLSKKTVCISDVSVNSISQSGSSLSFNTVAGSPMLKSYGSMYVPSQVVDYLKSSVTISVDIKNSAGVSVSVNSVDKDVVYGGSVSSLFSGSFADGSYTAVVSTSSAGEAQCLVDSVQSESFDFVVSTYDDDKDDDGYKEDVDCDDNDASVWGLLDGYLDSDLDGYGVVPKLDVCSGTSLPSGYVSNDDDCDDGDSGIWQILTGYLDGDGDGSTGGNILNVCTGASLPSGYSDVNGNDCDDNNINIWQLLFGYFDFDGDNFGVGPGSNVCSGSSLFGTYTSVDGDCNDYDLNINPDAVEICDDGIDNDCDGDIDEGCDFVPSVFVSASPLSGVFPLDVSFNCQGVGGNGDLSYSWDFADGGSSSLQSPTHTYTEAGSFDAGCKVQDEDGDEVVGYIEIEVGMQDLEVNDLVCFDKVIKGHNQSCSVSVYNSLGSNAGGVDVDIFYSDGTEFGSCITDGITGACGVKSLQNVIGDFEVYAVASKTGYLSDDDEEPKFKYAVWEEEYSIVYLKIFSDDGFSIEDYDFFRGEDLFVSFGVEDSFGDTVSADLITNVSLVSSVAGGRVDLNRFDKVGSFYYYDLISIPVVHEFLGDSNVFAFVFDVADSSGGQEEVSLIIRNNLPVISPDIPSQDVEEGDVLELNLSLYESDTEDSGDDLSWEVVSYGSGVAVNLVGKMLFIEGANEGEAEIVLRLVDLDEDYDEQILIVGVEDDSHYRGCDVDWECSPWSDCENGFETRSCFNVGSCNKEINRPLELKSCSSSSMRMSENGIISFGKSLSSENEMEFSILWIIVGALALLILLMLLLILLLRNR